MWLHQAAQIGFPGAETFEAVGALTIEQIIGLATIIALIQWGLTARSRYVLERKAQEFRAASEKRGDALIERVLTVNEGVAANKQRLMDTIDMMRNQGAEEREAWRTTIADVANSLADVSRNMASMQTTISTGFDAQAARLDAQSLTMTDNNAHMVTLIGQVEALNSGIGTLNANLQKVTVTADVMMVLDRIEANMKRTLAALDNGTRVIEKKKDTGELKDAQTNTGNNATAIHLPAGDGAGRDTSA